MWAQQEDRFGYFIGRYSFPFPALSRRERMAKSRKLASAPLHLPIRTERFCDPDPLFQERVETMTGRKLLEFGGKVDGHDGMAAPQLLQIASFAHPPKL
jgi:hypothetical protein